MVKGCQRRVLHVKNPEGGLFEEAFFLLKDAGTDGRIGASRADMVREANRILSGGEEPEGRANRRRAAPLFLLGALFGAAVSSGAIFLIFFI